MSKEDSQKGNEDNFPTLLEDIRDYYVSSSLEELMIKARSFIHDNDVTAVLAARLILEEAKKFGENCRIIDIHVESNHPDDDLDDPRSAHSFVIFDGMKEDDFPYNMPNDPDIIKPRVGDLLSEGKDVTEEVLKSPWPALMR